MKSVHPETSAIPPPQADMSVVTVDELIARIKIVPHTFDVFGEKVFAVSPDADPGSIRNAADLLLDLTERLSSDLCSGRAPEDKTLAALIQLLSGAAKASYRSLVGQP